MSARPRQAPGSRGEHRGLSPQLSWRLWWLQGDWKPPSSPSLEPQGLWNAGGCGGSRMAGTRPSRELQWGDSAGGPSCQRTGGWHSVHKASSPLPTPTPEYLASLGTRAGWPPLFLPLPSPGPGLCRAFSLASWPVTIWPLHIHLARGRGHDL